LEQSMVGEALLSVALGVLGALTYIIVWAERREDLSLEEVIRTLALGAIAGLIYFILHTDYGFPDRLMTIVSGYFARDFIPAVLTKARMILEVLLGQKLK
jgi:hypothetical protein